MYQQQPVQEEHRDIHVLHFSLAASTPETFPERLFGFSSVLRRYAELWQTDHCRLM